ncbi:MAG: hypothetical protein JSR80_04925 [Verrucomicrobia bacterium]|nr:hypothetical protein [Verrucomicrobiota bacterium]
MTSAASHSKCTKSSEWNRDNLKLDEYRCIRGTLVCQGVSEIIINENLYNEKLFISYDSGALLDFDINGDVVEMGINWTNYPPKHRIRDYWSLKIKSKKILCKDSLNPILLNLTGSKMGIYRNKK